MTPTFNLADLFEIVAAAVPDREALVCGDRRLTYAALDDRANRLAAVLTARGVLAGDHVGLHLYNGTEYIEGMVAAFKLRAVPININYRYGADELRYLFTDADVRALIHEPAFADVVSQVAPDVPTLVATLARGVDYEQALATVVPRTDFPTRSGDDLYILYTGGTTGMPKGVMWHQEDLFFAALGGGNPGGEPLTDPGEAGARAARGRTRCLPACPFMHGTAHWLAWSTLLTGGTVVVSPAHHFDAPALLDAAERERVTFLVVVGDAFARPIVDALANEPGRWDLAALSVILSGGAILSPSVKSQLAAHLPGAIVIDGFGASETGGQGQMVSGSADDHGRARFIVGSTTAVVDEFFRPVVPGSGAIGRVASRGRIPVGYYKDPEKSAATFPVVDGERWAVAGDMATVEADGSIALLGRGSVSINTGGEKVYPEEVESAIKSHPDVFDALVVGVPDDRWGERVTAVLQLRPGRAAPSVADIANHARKSVAGYKIPRAVVIVDHVVRSPSGKPDYRWAREAAARAPS